MCLDIDKTILFTCLRRADKIDARGANVREGKEPMMIFKLQLRSTCVKIREIEGETDQTHTFCFRYLDRVAFAFCS